MMATTSSAGWSSHSLHLDVWGHQPQSVMLRGLPADANRLFRKAHADATGCRVQLASEDEAVSHPRLPHTRSFSARPCSALRLLASLQVSLMQW